MAISIQSTAEIKEVTIVLQIGDILTESDVGKLALTVMLNRVVMPVTTLGFKTLLEPANIDSIKRN